MKKKVVCMLSAVMALGCLSACTQKQDTRKLENLEDFSYLVGYTAQLPAPYIPETIGKGLDYSVSVKKPSGAEIALRKTSNGVYTLDVETEGEYLLTYTVVNAEKEKFTKKITMTAEKDTEKPVLGLPYEELDELELGSVFTVPDIEVADNSTLAPYNAKTYLTVSLATPDGERTACKVGDEIGIEACGGYSLLYTATDDSGNSAQKEVPFTIAENEDADYKVEYYLENMDGSYTLSAEHSKKERGMANMKITAELPKIAGYQYDENNENNLISARIKEDGSLVLKAYYNRVVKSRYEVKISDGKDVGDGIGLDTEYTKTEDEWSYSTFEGKEVIELKMTGTGETSGQVALLHFSRTGGYETALKQASGKKYIGFRIYSPLQSEVLMQFLVHTGKGAYEQKWRLCYGWNEFSIDLNKFLADKNAKFVASEENPIYRIGIGISDKVCDAKDKEVLFYIDDIYATDYDMENIADFESAGDLNRYTYGESVTSDYTYNAMHYGMEMSTAVSGVEFDGQKTLQWTLTEPYGYLHLYAGLNNNYKQLWMPEDLSGYTAIKLRVRAEDDKQMLKVSLTSKDGSTLINLAEILSRTAEWVDYTIDLTSFSAEQLKQIKQLTFNTQGAGADATGKSIYFDYIQFIK